MAYQDFWNPDRVQVLRQEWQDGATGSEIARIIGTTRSAIMGKVSRLRKDDRLGSAEVRAKALRSRTKKPAHRDRAKAVPKPKNAPRAIIAPIPPPAIIEGGVPFMELGHEHCRAVVGHDGFLARFCGGPKTVRIVRGKPNMSAYCDDHHNQYHQPDRR